MRQIMIEVTDEQRAAIDRIAKERGLTLRDLITSAVLGSEPTSLTSRVCQIEARLALLERK